jgi:hypothetical protein
MYIIEITNSAYPQATHSMNGIHAPNAMMGAVINIRSRARVVGSIIAKDEG